jgi:hypothetical protein
LSVICGETLTQIHSILGPAVLDGYVSPQKTPGFFKTLSELGSNFIKPITSSFSSMLSVNSSSCIENAISYKFSHDFLYEHLLKDIEPLEYQKISLSIARGLKNSVDFKEGNEIEIITYYRKAIELIVNEEERKYVAELHYELFERILFRVGENAIQYLETAMLLLSPLNDNSKKIFELKFLVILRLCKNLIRFGRLDESEIILGNCKQFLINDINNSSWNDVMIVLRVAQKKFSEALSLGLSSVFVPFCSLGGLIKSNDYSAFSGLDGMLKLDNQFGTKKIDEILNPTITSTLNNEETDRNLRLCMEICKKNSDLHKSAYFSILVLLFNKGLLSSAKERSQ